MDEPLPHTDRSFRTYRVPVEVVFNDVGRRHEPGREIARLKEVIRTLQASGADVTQSVENVFIGQDSVGDDEIVDQRGIARSLRRLCRLPRGNRGKGDGRAEDDDHAPDTGESHAGPLFQ